MKKKRIWAAGFIFCMSLLFLGACEKHSLQTRDKLHVGVTYYDQSDTFMNELIACVRKKMEELGGKGSGYHDDRSGGVWFAADTG